VGAVLFTVRSSSWLGGLCELNLLPYWKISLVVHIDSQIAFVLLVLPYRTAMQRALLCGGTRALLSEYKR